MTLQAELLQLISVAMLPISLNSPAVYDNMKEIPAASTALP